jgi:DNA-directed RNA polymerase specialized sigma24 family protein
MAADDSVTFWMTQLKAGDAAAAQKLWEGYFHRLVALARQRLRGSRRREADEEDVALSAFDSFCRGAAGGRFPRLADRDDLWQVLVLLAARKALNQVEWEHRRKRGGGAVRGESAFLNLPNEDSAAAGLEHVIGREPTPVFAAQVADECDRLLGRLGDPDLRAIALWKMEGYTNEEIGQKLGCAVATVERRLQLIRKLWTADGGRE